YVEDASPAAQSPEYVLEFDLKAHPEDDDDEDPEEDPVDYPTDGGDDGDDEEGLLAMSSPPASPLSPWCSPPPRIPFPPLSPPSPVLSPAPPPSPIRSLGYRAAMIRRRAEALPSASRRVDRPEVTLPPWKMLGDDSDDEEESSEDDEDDEDDQMDIEDDEEEHPAPADSVVVAPTTADRPHLRRRRSHLRLISPQLHHHHTLHIVRQLGFLFQLQYLCQ
nr:hypothetical protein [Tanacetum cinerariifolium]